MREENLKLRMAIIAGASHALKYRDKNPRADTAEVIKHISDKADEILEKMGEEEN